MLLYTIRFLPCNCLHLAVHCCTVSLRSQLDPRLNSRRRIHQYNEDDVLEYEYKGIYRLQTLSLITIFSI